MSDAKHILTDTLARLGIPAPAATAAVLVRELEAHGHTITKEETNE